MLQEERLVWLGAFQEEFIYAPKLARKNFISNSPSNEQWMEYIISAMGYDWNIVMKRFNEVFDEQIQHGTTTPQEFSDKNHVLVLSFFSSKKVRSQMLAQSFITMSFGAAEWLHESEHRVLCRERTQRLVLAMLLYEKEQGTLPPAFTVDAQGKPLHSWRVLLLPYLGSVEKKLYENLRLDEPWDSDWNRQFHETQIAAYTCPSAQVPKGQCHDYVIVGDDTPFASQPKFDTESGKTLGRLSSDFEANTIFVLEQNKPICWMDPTQEISQTEVDAVDEISCVSDFFPRIHKGLIFTGYKSGTSDAISDAHMIETFQELMRGTQRR